MVTRDPLTRYWFIDQLARSGALAAVDDGWIIRPLRPSADQRPARPEPRPHAEIVRDRDAALKAAFHQGDNTHVDPRDGRAARRHLLAHWDRS